MRTEQRHILKRGASRGKAGRRLDEVGAGTRDEIAQAELFRLREQAGLHDDLEHMGTARLLHGAQLIKHLVVEAVLHPAEVDNHVDLLRAVSNRVLRLEHLGGRGVVTVWETDHGADGQAPLQERRGTGHIGRRDADAGRAIPHGVFAQRADLFPAGSRSEQRVINGAQDRFHIHLPSPLHSASSRAISIMRVKPVCRSSAGSDSPRSGQSETVSRQSASFPARAAFM